MITDVSVIALSVKCFFRVANISYFICFFENVIKRLRINYIFKSQYEPSNRRLHSKPLASIA